MAFFHTEEELNKALDLYEVKSMSKFVHREGEIVEGINPLYSKNISVNDTSNKFGTHYLDTLGFQKLTGSK